MTTVQSQNDEFVFFQKKYETILEKFLKEEGILENSLHEGYQFGRLAISKNLGILSVVAIHHDYVIDFLEKLTTDNHLDIANKASLFLEEVLSSYQMVANDFGDAIKLLNKRSVEFAVRIRALQDSLKEKEVLLKEVYHRVKNNLQVISSLLNLQVEAMQDPTAQEALIESATRVKSMALVHEMLYQSENLAKIDMGEYVKNLFQYLYDIYNVDPELIKYIIDIDSVSLNIDFAIPCGLIINEIISNTFKHAFPNDQSGKIDVSLKKQANQIMLNVKDNGVGISPEINLDKIQSLGMQLIHNLSKQLGGDIILDRNQGTKFTLTFLLNDK